MHRNVHFWTVDSLGFGKVRATSTQGLGLAGLREPAIPGVAVDNDFEGDDA
jgi:hypothetical protein